MEKSWNFTQILIFQRSLSLWLSTLTLFKVFNFIDQACDCIPRS